MHDSRRAAHVTVRLVMTMTPLAAMKSLSPEAQKRTLEDVTHLVMAFLFGEAPPPETADVGNVETA